MTLSYVVPGEGVQRDPGHRRASGDHGRFQEQANEGEHRLEGKTSDLAQTDCDGFLRLHSGHGAVTPAQR